MKRFMTPNRLTAICTLGGLACMGLRHWLLTAGVDERGLLDLGHPGNWLSWLVTAAVWILVLISVWHPVKFRMVPSLKATLGGSLSIAGCLVACNMLFHLDGHPLNLPAAIAAAAAAVCRLWILISTCRRKRVRTMASVPVTAFFLMFLVCRYQYWNSEPEPQLCVFHIMALMSLALTVYFRSILLMDRKKGKWYLQSSRWAIFTSLAAIPGCMDALPLLLWAGALILDGCTLRKKAVDLPEAETSDREPGTGETDTDQKEELPRQIPEMREP